MMTARQRRLEALRQRWERWYAKNGYKHRRRSRLYYAKHKKAHGAKTAALYRKGLGMTRSEVMSQIGGCSMVELAARKLASTKAGCRLIHQPRGILGRPDYGNATKMVAVFVHGCYWHGCPKHFKMPKTNVAFWRAKIGRNKQRDRVTVRRLRSAGWTVIVLWECDVTSRRGRLA